MGPRVNARDPPESALQGSRESGGSLWNLTLRVCELSVGLGDVEVLGVEDAAGEPLGVHIRRRSLRPPCGSCGGPLWSDGERLTR